MNTKLKLITSLALLTAVSFTTPATAADYVIDSKMSHASINFRIKHLGYAWLTGRFDKFNGTFSFDENAPEASKVKVEIDTASVNSNFGDRDKHLRSGDFLAVSDFPTASFESTSIKLAGKGKAVINGKFTMRGIAKDIAIDAEYIGGGKDPWGGFRQGFTGTTKISLADYGIKFNLGPASKEVELTLHIEGIKQ